VGGGGDGRGWCGVGAKEEGGAQRPGETICMGAVGWPLVCSTTELLVVPLLWVCTQVELQGPAKLPCLLLSAAVQLASMGHRLEAAWYPAQCTCKECAAPKRERVLHTAGGEGVVQVGCEVLQHLQQPPECKRLVRAATRCRVHSARSVVCQSNRHALAMLDTCRQ
jgi:hypothetical protein